MHNPHTWLTSPFQSTRSARSATTGRFFAFKSDRFQSTRSARSATCKLWNIILYPLQISIHALREERDCTRSHPQDRPTSFQSNPLARSATSVHHDEDHTIERFQSTRSARSATMVEAAADAGSLISIHALREERDLQNPRETST